MLDIPENDKLNQTLHIKTFLKKELSSAEKKRLQKTLLSVVLDAQIAGESIPSLINDQYNCQVIMLLSAKLASIKDASFVAELLQNAIKPLCILQLADGRESRFSFALKRLNRQNSSEVVIESTFLTPTMGTPPEGLSFTRLKNRNNKFLLYREWQLRAFLLFQPHLYAGIPDLLEANFWYNDTQTRDVEQLLMELKRLRDAARKAILTSERIKINTEITKILEQLNSYTDPKIEST